MHCLLMGNPLEHPHSHIPSNLLQKDLKSMSHYKMFDLTVHLFDNYHLHPAANIQQL